MLATHGLPAAAYSESAAAELCVQATR